MMLHRHFEKEADREKMTTSADLAPKPKEKEEEAPKRRRAKKD